MVALTHRRILNAVLRDKTLPDVKRVSFMLSSISRLACATAFLGIGALCTVSTASAASFNDDQRKEIGEIVRAYLIQNPEVLQEVVSELEKKQQEETAQAQEAALKTSQKELYDSPYGSIVGNPNGTATIVEFFDYNCGYCKHALQDLGEMMKADPNLKVVLKDLPVLGQDSREAAMVALAVKQQLSGAKLFDYHSKLLSTKGRVGREQALTLAQGMGLDMDKLKKDMVSTETGAALKENAMLANKLGLSGTPAFVIGDTVIPGAVGRDPLEKMIANTRKCGKAAC